MWHLFLFFCLLSFFPLLALTLLNHFSFTNGAEDCCQTETLGLVLNIHLFNWDKTTTSSQFQPDLTCKVESTSDLAPNLDSNDICEESYNCFSSSRWEKKKKNDGEDGDKSSQFMRQYIHFWSICRRSGLFLDSHLVDGSWRPLNSLI